MKASEPKSDLGLDEYAPGELFENGLGRGAACSNSATLTKIRDDIKEAQKGSGDLKVLFFATPRPVSEKKAKGGREKVKKDYGITLIVISREEAVSELLRPENASLCVSILRIPARRRSFSRTGSGRLSGGGCPGQCLVAPQDNGIPVDRSQR